jgi:hypothetical protein
VEVNIEVMDTRVCFEVIEIMDDSKPYPYLLGIDEEFDNNVVLNLKKKNSFETKTFHIIMPLYLIEGNIYNDPVNEDAHSSIIENIYNITGPREYYANHTTNGNLRWISVCSYDTNSKDSMERWKNTLYEVSTRRCS